MQLYPLCKSIFTTNHPVISARIGSSGRILISRIFFSNCPASWDNHSLSSVVSEFRSSIYCCARFAGDFW